MSKATILLVDDELEIRRIYSEGLEKGNYQIIDFETAEDALRTFNKDPDQFDLALVDYNLPGMDGITLTKKMHIQRPDLPVILISGYVNNPQKKLQFSVDVDIIITKPVDIDQLNSVVHRVLEPESSQE